MSAITGPLCEMQKLTHALGESVQAIAQCTDSGDLLGASHQIGMMRANAQALHGMSMVAMDLLYVEKNNKERK